MDSPRRKPFLGVSPWLTALSAAACVALFVVYFTVPLDFFGPARPVFSWIFLLCALLVLAALILYQIRLVVTDSDKGRPALAIALLIVLSLFVFSRTYLALALADGQFNGLHTRIDALYFTVTTMSTVGYGDVSAVGQAARVVVMVQILFNFVFLTAGASALTRRLRGKALTRAVRRQQGDG